MCVSAVVLWASTAALQSEKVRLEREKELKPGIWRTWTWYKQMIVFGPHDVLRDIWFRVKEKLVQAKVEQEDV
jgi:hypothetical protein